MPTQKNIQKDFAQCEFTFRHKKFSSISLVNYKILIFLSVGLFNLIIECLTFLFLAGIYLRMLMVYFIVLCAETFPILRLDTVMYVVCIMIYFFQIYIYMKIGNVYIYKTIKYTIYILPNFVLFFAEILKLGNQVTLEIKFILNANSKRSITVNQIN